MKRFVRWCVRVFATYQFERLLAEDIKQYQTRCAHLEEMLVYTVDSMQKGILFDDKVIDEHKHKMNAILAEAGAIKYRREKANQLNEIRAQLNKGANKK